MMFYRYTYCGGNGGLVIADTKDSAVEKLEKKYGKKATGEAEVWPWEQDEFCDPENLDVLNIYDN